MKPPSLLTAKYHGPRKSVERCIGFRYIPAIELTIKTKLRLHLAAIYENKQRALNQIQTN